MIHSILAVQITCLAIFLHNLSTCPLWPTSWSGAIHLIFHTFLHPISVFFSQHMPIPSQPVLLQYHLFLVFLLTSYLELYVTLTLHIKVLHGLVLQSCSSPFLQAAVPLPSRSHEAPSRSRPIPMNIGRIPVLIPRSVAEHIHAFFLTRFLFYSG